MGDRVRFVPHSAWSAAAAVEPRISSALDIRVLSPGFQTTVQDLGRFGYAHFGVSASGAADPLALRAGNLLVGNAENAAALEMTLVGGAFEFETDAVIALTGSDFGAGLPLWTAVEIKAGANRALRRHSFRRALLPGGARRHRRAQGHGQRFRPRHDGGGRPSACAPATCFPSAMPPSAGRAAGAAPRSRIRAHRPAAGHRGTAGALVFRRTLRRRVSGGRGIQPHGPPPARAGHSQPGGPHAHRGRAAGRGAGAARTASPSFSSSSTRPPAAIPSPPT